MYKLKKLILIVHNICIITKLAGVVLSFLHTVKSRVKMYLCNL